MAAHPVSTTTVHPAVWADAVRAAGGDKRRIEIVSAHSVVVHNTPDWRSERGRVVQLRPRQVAAATAEPTRPAKAAPAEDAEPVAAPQISIPTFVAPQH